MSTGMSRSSPECPVRWTATAWQFWPYLISLGIDGVCNKKTKLWNTVEKENSASDVVGILQDDTHTLLSVSPPGLFPFSPLSSSIPIYIFFLSFSSFPPLPSPVWDVSDTSGNILKSWSRLRPTLRAFWVSRRKKHKNSLPASRLYIGLTLVARRHKVKSLFCSKERRQYDRLEGFVKEGMYRKSRQSAASEAIFIDDLITRFVSRTEFVCVRVRCFRAMTDKHCFVNFNNPYLKVAL